MLPVYRPCCVRVGGSTHLVKHVMFGLSLNLLGCNWVGHKHDTRTHFVSPSHKYGFVSDVDHAQFKTGQATNEKGMQQYLGHQYCTTSFSG
jgi:hypothetical protein